MERNFIAFISYRHRPLDTAVAKMLHSSIEQYVIPRNLRRGSRKFGPVFRDEEEMRVSIDLTSDIYSALDHSEYLIVVCSSATMEHSWVDREIEYFLRNHPSENILVVMAEGQGKEVFPKALTHLPQKDGSIRIIEPKALNISGKSLREVRSNLRQRIPELYAAMLDCSYDRLVQRENRRRNRRLTGMFSVVLSVATIFSSVLTFKNLQLEQERDAVLLRESELLTQNAREALARGDRMTAIEDAVSALPGEDDRPYYAPAEAVLISAAGIIDNVSEDLMIDETLVEHFIPVEDFFITADGSKAVTLDAYKTVSVFDTQTAGKLWSRKLQFDFPSGFIRMLPCSINDSAIVYGGEKIYSVHTQSGNILWEYECPEGWMGFNNYVFQSADQKTLVFMVYEFTPTSEYVKFVKEDLVFLDAASGEVRCTMNAVSSFPFDWFHNQDYYKAHQNKEASLKPHVSFQSRIYDAPLIGSVSDDGTRFAGCYYAITPQCDTWICYFVADTNKGTCEVVYQEEYQRDTETVFATHFTDNDQSITVVRNGADQLDAGSAFKISLADHNLVWRTVLPGQSLAPYSDDVPIDTVLLSDRIAIAREDTIFLLNLQDGLIADTVSMPSAVEALLTVDDHCCGILLEDGTYLLGWVDEDGFHDSRDLPNGTFQIDRSADSVLWNSGFLQPERSGDEVIGMKAGAGFSASIPEDNDSCISIQRIRFSGAPFTREVVYKFWPGESFAPSFTQMCSDGILALGSIGYTYGNGQFSRRHQLIDINSFEKVGNVTDTFIHSGFVFPDGSGMIEATSSGIINLSDAETGRITVLSEAYTTFTDENGEKHTEDNHYACESVVQTGSRDVLTVRYEPEGLTIWTNGADPVYTPYPRALVQGAEGGETVYLFQTLGENGYIVLCNLYVSDGNYLPGFSVYDTRKGKWTLVRYSMTNFTSRMAIGKSRAVFAVADRHAVIHTIDLTGGNLVGIVPLSFSADAIKDIQFVSNDEYLMIKTYDGQIRILDPASGETVYHNSGPYRYDACFEDPDEERLFLACRTDQSENTGLCIDTRTWTTLAEIPGMILYDADSNRVFQCIYDSKEKPKEIVSFIMPGTGELIEACRTLFDLS